MGFGFRVSGFGVRVWGFRGFSRVWGLGLLDRNLEGRVL